ncbi:MAG: ATP-binding protein [Lachnospiraceae bacterium]|nr:ATP-binding protein [Lachnospiraceae bacterium]
MFYCREEELRTMNRRYERNRFECVIIYGRRRVGKTALINEFCKDKRTIYFSALNASSRENLEALSKAIYTCKNPDSMSVVTFGSYADALDEITAMAVQERLVFVIDEYPYLARAENSISSRLQHIIDHKWQDSQLYLILCGSSMSFMEYQVLGYESPLYGRRTAQLRIQALTYREMTAFHPGLSAEDQALLYGITGGIPHYINKLDVEAPPRFDQRQTVPSTEKNATHLDSAAQNSLDRALLENLFAPSGYLFEEPENLLKQELREPGIYNSVITAVAGGASRANEIATRVGLESGVCAKYLKVLLDLGILKKKSPITEKAGRKTIYAIEDNFFRFWYRFVPRNMSVINAGRMSFVYEQAVKQNLPGYMGLVFEKMCQDYLLRYAEDLPIVLGDIGEWWGNDAITRTEIQIDIVGTSVEGNEYLIGSCKYKNEKIGVDELELLRRYASVFRKNGVFHYYIFSKGGFTTSLIELERNGIVKLLTLNDFY